MTERDHPSWYAFAAGAVVMLLLVLIWFAWQGRDDVGVAARVAAHAVGAAPKVPAPHLPEAPHIPDAPVPTPK
jgi:hypothetical protein